MIKEIFNKYGIAAVNHPERESIESVREFLNGLVSDASGSERVSIICDTSYRHLDGAHKGVGRGCFWEL